LIFASCSTSEQNEFGRSVEVFLIGLLQVVNMVIFGVLSMIFCIISASNPKSTYKVLGWIFLLIFLLFFAFGYIAVTEARPRHFEIYYIFIMEFVMVVISLLFVIRKPKTSNTSENRDQYLDKIIDDKDEIL